MNFETCKGICEKKNLGTYGEETVLGDWSSAISYLVKIQKPNHIYNLVWIFFSSFCLYLKQTASCLDSVLVLKNRIQNRILSVGL